MIKTKIPTGPDDSGVQRYVTVTRCFDCPKKTWITHEGMVCDDRFALIPFEKAANTISEYCPHLEKVYRKCTKPGGVEGCEIIQQCAGRLSVGCEHIAYACFNCGATPLDDESKTRCGRRLVEIPPCLPGEFLNDCPFPNCKFVYLVSIYGNR